MGDIRLESPGACIAFGAANARLAYCIDGDINGFSKEPTPSQPDLFFKWMAERVLTVAHSGSGWLVVGYPGPVSNDGKTIGPFANIGGMNQGTFNIRNSLSMADPAVGRLLDEGFALLNVNDGELAAQAAAKFTEYKYGRVGALIIGSGYGAGVAEKEIGSKIYRIDRRPNEIGHIMFGDDPRDTPENRWSGNAINKLYGDPKALSEGHIAWATVARGVQFGRSVLGAMNGVEVVVPTGGIGIGAVNKYSQLLDTADELVDLFGNGTQKHTMPELRFVPAARCDEFEVDGAEGVMLDYISQAA